MEDCDYSTVIILLFIFFWLFWLSPPTHRCLIAFLTALPSASSRLLYDETTTQRASTGKRPPHSQLCFTCSFCAAFTLSSPVCEWEAKTKRFFSHFMVDAWRWMENSIFVLRNTGWSYLEELVSACKLTNYLDTVGIEFKLGFKLYHQEVKCFQIFLNSVRTVRQIYKYRGCVDLCYA